jgi:hypothetical protein
MGRDTLVGFRIDTTISFWGVVFYLKMRALIFGMPDARMSSSQHFQRFGGQARLTISSLAYQMP